MAFVEKELGGPALSGWGGGQPGGFLTGVVEKRSLPAADVCVRHPEQAPAVGTNSSKFSFRRPRWVGLIEWSWTVSWMTCDIFFVFLDFL